MNDSRNRLPNVSWTRLALPLALTALLAACAEPTQPGNQPAALSAVPTIGDNPSARAPQPGADVLQGDFLLADSDAPALASTCPSQGFAGNGWTVVFGHSLCLIVTPLWASTTNAPYPLTDDVTLSVLRERGKYGRITHVRLYAQDVIGDAGIAHETDWVVVAQPVVPSKAGFTLHVHAKNIQVWRLDSHLSGGNRVDMIGTISIGDIVYPQR